MPGELPLVILALLSEREQGGYELLRELERRYGPSYRPSPGSIYPALAALRAEQLVQPLDDGRRSSFRPTAAGRRLLAEQQHVLARVEQRTGTAQEGGDLLQPILARFADRVTRLAGHADLAAVERILDDATKTIANLETHHEK